MKDEMVALDENGTLDLEPHSGGKKMVSCKWAYTVELNPDSPLAWLKARLVSKGYDNTYGVDYHETLSHVAKTTSVRILISLAATYH